jgi:hypothetical protein
MARLPGLPRVTHARSRFCPLQCVPTSLPHPQRNPHSARRPSVLNRNSSAPQRHDFTPQPHSSGQNTDKLPMRRIYVTKVIWRGRFI